MPQMMPINWLISFFFFITIFILFNMFNYYIFINNKLSTNSSFNLKKNNFNWKW